MTDHLINTTGQAMRSYALNLIQSRSAVCMSHRSSCQLVSFLLSTSTLSVRASNRVF